MRYSKLHCLNAAFCQCVLGTTKIRSLFNQDLVHTFHPRSEAQQGNLGLDESGVSSIEQRPKCKILQVRKVSFFERHAAEMGASAAGPTFSRGQRHRKSVLTT